MEIPSARDLCLEVLSMQETFLYENVNRKGSHHREDTFVFIPLGSPLYYWHLVGLVMTDPFKADGPTNLAHGDGRCHLLPKKLVKPPDRAHAVAEPICLWSEHIQGVSWVTTRNPCLLQWLKVLHQCPSEKLGWFLSKVLQLKASEKATSST